MKLPEIRVCDRAEFVLSYARGRTVLHVGCADWPYTESKLRRNALLHEKLSLVATRLSGVDTNDQAVQLMLDAGFSDIHRINGKQPLRDQISETFDVVVAGETIEHCGDALSFLESIRSVCRDDTTVIITTANFAPIKKLPRLLARIEAVHPDHVSYYSYSTLTQLLSRARLCPAEWAAYWEDYGPLSRYANALLKRMARFNYFADGFCVACRTSHPDENI